MKFLHAKLHRRQCEALLGPHHIKRLLGHYLVYLISKLRLPGATEFFLTQIGAASLLDRRAVSTLCQCLSLPSRSCCARADHRALAIPCGRGDGGRIQYENLSFGAFSASGSRLPLAASERDHSRHDDPAYGQAWLGAHYTLFCHVSNRRSTGGYRSRHGP